MKKPKEISNYSDFSDLNNYSMVRCPYCEQIITIEVGETLFELEHEKTTYPDSDGTMP